jgi:hypothetical protein
MPDQDIASAVMITGSFVILIGGLCGKGPAQLAGK